MKLCPKCQKQFSDDANFCPVDAARLSPLESQAATADALSARFDLGDRLGGGRTGAVHRATDKASGQVVAVKIIAPAVTALPGLLQRLERELKQLERVQTAGVAKVLASGKRGDEPWVALELLDRVLTLADAIAARGPMPADQAAKLIDIVGEALIEAAQVGVVHRDLAPKNILFSGDDVKLINFSLPVPADKVPGVAEFVAPEQHDGKPVDQRSNLYSLGALYYFILTGQPVQLDDHAAIRPPSALASVPVLVDALILRALDRSPTKRFLTVRQFVDEVGRVARGEVDVGPDGRPSKPKSELIQTLLGVATGSDTIPDGLVPAAVLAGERSPWASPAAGTGSPVAAGLGEAGPGVTTLGVAPLAAGAAAAAGQPAVSGVVAPRAPVLPAPAGALALDATAKRSTNDAKGMFRETMWFKKGELDAQAADAAAADRAKTGKDTANDKHDQLPIDERYKDDGSLSRSDKDKYSLRTGATAALATVRDSGSHTGMAKVSDAALIDELKRGRNRIVAAIAVGLVAVLVIIFLIAH